MKMACSEEVDGGTVGRSDNKPVTLDEVLSKFNIFGRYHVTVTVLIFFAFMTNAIYSVNYIFVVEKIDYRCVFFLSAAVLFLIWICDTALVVP